MQREPAAIIASIEVAVVAVITAVLLAAGEDINGAFALAILGAAAAIVKAVGAIIVRMNVWSASSHEAAVEAARKEG